MEDTVNLLCVQENFTKSQQIKLIIAMTISLYKHLGNDSYIIVRYCQHKLGRYILVHGNQFLIKSNTNECSIQGLIAMKNI